MAFFKSKRSGPKVGGDCKKGGGVAGPQGNIIDVSYKIPGAGESKSYEQNVVKRAGAKL